MKRNIKGSTLIELMMVTAIITVVVFAALSFFYKTKEALHAQEKRYVKQLMIGGIDPFSIKTIPPANIEKYKQEILKENALAVAAGTEEVISTSNEYVNPVKNTVVQPVEKTISKPIVAAAPVVKQVTENHYHFETLTTVLKYIGIGALGVLSLLGLIKLIMYTKQVLTVKSAVRASQKIVVNFDNNFDENKNYLHLLRNLSDQVIINSVLIENRKNKDSVVNLIVNNEKLKTRLSLMESNLMNKGLSV